MNQDERQAARQELLEDILQVQGDLDSMIADREEALTAAQRQAFDAHTMTLDALVIRHGSLFEAAMVMRATKSCLDGLKQELSALDGAQP